MTLYTINSLTQNSSVLLPELQTLFIWTLPFQSCPRPRRWAAGGSGGRTARRCCQACLPIPTGRSERTIPRMKYCYAEEGMEGEEKSWILLQVSYIKANFFVWLNKVREDGKIIMAWKFRDHIVQVFSFRVWRNTRRMSSCSCLLYNFSSHCMS